MPIAAFLRVFGIASLLCLSMGCTNTHSVSAQSLKPGKDRKMAPDFDLKDINGRSVKLSDFRGRAVLLDFWATWCGPCKIEIPWFVEFERKYKDRGLTVIGVAMDDEGWKVVKPFVEDLKVNYRIVVGSDTTADLYGGVEALPTTFILDRDGRIAKTHIGVSSKDDFENEIEKVLQAPSGTASAAVALRASRAE